MAVRRAALRRLTGLQIRCQQANEGPELWDSLQILLQVSPSCHALPLEGCTNRSGRLAADAAMHHQCLQLSRLHLLCTYAKVTARFSHAESPSADMQMAADGRSPGLPITGLAIRAAFVHLLWGLQRLRSTASLSSQELTDLAGQAQALADQLERIFATAETLEQQDAVFQTQADLFLIFSPDKLPVSAHYSTCAWGLMVTESWCALLPAAAS